MSRVETRPKVTVIGSNMMDLITYVQRFPVPGETVEAHRFDLGFGGKGANQAVAAAKLGAEVHMVTNVGDDLFADAVIENLKSHGINADLVKKIPGVSSGVAPIFVDEQGENSILIAKGANDSLTVDDPRIKNLITASDIVLLQLEIPLETVYTVLDMASQYNVKTILNPAPMDPSLDLHRIGKLDYLIPNETELALLTGKKCDTLDEVLQAAESLLDSTIGTVIVTLGSQGAYVINASGAMVIAPPKVTPLDTTGAGDAFIGSFALFSLLHEDLELSVRKANQYAAFSTLGRGTQKSYLSRSKFGGCLQSL